MPEQLLTVLKICMLVLLYLFFLRVLRAVWTELREPGDAASAQPRRRSSRAPRPRATPRAVEAAPGYLVAVEGTAAPGADLALQSELTIGRAPSCTISVDDTYASAVHTRVFRREDGWYLEDLGSTNGTYLNRRRASGTPRLAVGDVISVGNCSWEVR